jgi:hypothetical protein
MHSAGFGVHDRGRHCHCDSSYVGCRQWRTACLISRNVSVLLSVVLFLKLFGDCFDKNSPEVIVSEDYKLCINTLWRERHTCRRTHARTNECPLRVFVAATGIGEGLISLVVAAAGVGNGLISLVVAATGVGDGLISLVAAA